MAKKKKSPQEILTELCEKANDTVLCWKLCKEKGCNDPGWPDGMNMNLLRNHLISYKRKIKELCLENNIPLPAEAFIQNLPYVNNNYFANPTSERAKRIMDRPGWKCYNHEEPNAGDYDNSQLTLL